MQIEWCTQMILWNRLPAGVRRVLQRWLLRPVKRLLSRGVIRQPGFVMERRLDQAVPFLMIREGGYEPIVTSLLRNWLRPGDTFLDIGANVGYFTLLGAACVGPGGQVHSFEPHPVTFASLQRNVRLNGFEHVWCNALAVSSTEQPVQLWHDPETDLGMASLSSHAGQFTNYIECPATTLDAYMTTRAIHQIRAMKMDIEGAEVLALHGARSLLASPQRPQLLIVEAIEAHLQSTGFTVDALVWELQDTGYEVLRLVGDRSEYRLEPLVSGVAPVSSMLVART